jgi:hypothetical protein
VRAFLDGGPSVGRDKRQWRSGRLESLGVKWVDGDRWASEFCGRRDLAWRVLNECSLL